MDRPNLNRPPDKITIEEQRIYICAVAGPPRLFAGRTHNQAVVAGEPTRIAKNGAPQKIPVYVRVEIATGAPLTSVTLSTSKARRSDPGGAPVAQYIDAMLLPGEDLYASVGANTTLRVTEIAI